jgi:hypothetical protein
MQAIARQKREELKPHEVVPDPPFRLKGRTHHTYPKKCFERAYKYILDHRETEARLVHGQYHQGAGHAWVVIPGGIVFDGTMNRFYAAEVYYQIMQVVPEVEYAAEEAIELGVQHGHYGPWHAGRSGRL